MNTIITRHYPASKLPEDLREGIDPSSLVTVMITQRSMNPDENEGPAQHAMLTKEVDANLRCGPDERDE
jgi:hypothetical protein